MSNEYAVEMRDITKKFGGLIAVDSVSFKVKPGEIHALCGENGAGKSTLMNVLTGKFLASSYSGEILLNGNKVKINSPKDAKKEKITIVHQELELIPDLSIAENIFLGNQPTTATGVNWKKMNAEAQDILEKFSLNLNVKTKIKYLTVGQQQLVEIAKAIYLGGNVLILDEPSAPLTGREIDFLLATLEKLKKTGISIIYITHRLEEVFKLSDRVSVMRDGKMIDTFSTKEINVEELVAAMIGRKMENMYPDMDTEVGDVTLEISNYSVPHPLYDTNIVEDASMKFRAGEVVGISGLLGAGRTELMSAVIGAYKMKGNGTVKLNGKEVKFNSPAAAIKAGIGYVTEDRKMTGLILNQSIRFNVSMASLSRIIEHGVLSPSKEKVIVNELKDGLHIKTENIENPVSSLSGGNQQKVVLAKWLATKPGILILDEPTRGVDVGARFEIYMIIKELAAQGNTIIIISSDLPEIIGISNRVYVMYEGKVHGELLKDELGEDSIMRYATGIA
ncbi:sugar ABC transporter ATP-binding protein [Muricomes intestini]|uniref:sugar ABC transporter ATP-binding protein n=1 Tax=Muricomes intestini TaxID=1796634 RepID=UPI0026C2D273